MKQTTRWSPDTCGCVIEYEWDDSVKDTEREHTISRIVQPCKEHEGLGLKDADHFLQVTQENVSKNQAFEIVKAKAAEVNPDTFSYSFDKDRKLVIDVSGLDLEAADKAALLTELQTKLAVDVSIK